METLHLSWSCEELVDQVLIKFLILLYIIIRINLYHCR